MSLFVQLIPTEDSVGVKLPFVVDNTAFHFKYLLLADVIHPPGTIGSHPAESGVVNAASSAVSVEYEIWVEVGID